MEIFEDGESKPCVEYFNSLLTDDLLSYENRPF